MKCQLKVFWVCQVDWVEDIGVELSARNICKFIMGSCMVNSNEYDFLCYILISVIHMKYVQSNERLVFLESNK